MTAEVYHDDPCPQPSLSASIAHELVNLTPLHAWTAHPKLNPGFTREEKSHYDIGSMVHSLVLEGNADRVHVVNADDWRKKVAQEERDDARERGLIPLLEKDWTRVVDIATTIRAHLAARDDEPPLFTDGKPEQTLVWEERGVCCRARLDWLRDDFQTIDDLKTTARSANPLQWSRNTLWSIGADIQVAFYLRGLKRLTGVDAQFRYVLAETVPPYAVASVALAASALELGQAKVDRAIDRWRECLKTGRWPGYPGSTYYAETPAYEEMRWMEQDAEAATA
jgi:PDDEXK-like domain of unknown function (DUF3799)